MSWLLGSTASADVAEEVTRRWHYTAEIDPVTFALGGHGILLSTRPAQLPNWRFHVSSFSFPLPDALISDANKGFAVAIQPSATAAVNYVFGAGGRHRFRTGGALGFVRTRYTHDDTPGTELDVSAAAVSAQAGYQFFLTGNTGLFLELWVSAGVYVYESKELMIGSAKYDAPPVSVIPLFHIGYEL